MNRHEHTEARLILEGYRQDLDAKRRKHVASYQVTHSPVDDAVACAIAAALGTLEREIANLPLPTVGGAE